MSRPSIHAGFQVSSVLSLFSCVNRDKLPELLKSYYVNPDTYMRGLDAALELTPKPIPDEWMFCLGCVEKINGQLIDTYYHHLILIDDDGCYDLSCEGVPHEGEILPPRVKIGTSVGSLSWSYFIGMDVYYPPYVKVEEVVCALLRERGGYDMPWNSGEFGLCLRMSCNDKLSKRDRKRLRKIMHKKYLEESQV